MKKSDYEKYLDPKEFALLYEEWKAKGKPQGNDSLYVKIWDGVTNAVKACIGALQARYRCQYQDYDEKVLDGTILIMTKLLKMEDTPKNIVNLAYLPVLGVCCNKKVIAQEMENNNSLSLDSLTEGGDTFADLMYIDEEGEVHYGYNS